MLFLLACDEASHEARQRSDAAIPHDSATEHGGDGDSTPDAASRADASAHDVDAGLTEGESPTREQIKDRLRNASWTSLSWTPPDCVARVTHDVGDFPVVKWVPGTGPAAACETWLEEPGRVRAGGGYLRDYILDTADANDYATIVYDASGEPLYARRTACAFAETSTGTETCLSLTSGSPNGAKDTRIKCGDPWLDAEVLSSTEATFAFAASDAVVFTATYSSKQTFGFRRGDAPATGQVLMPGGDVFGLYAHGPTAMSLIQVTEGGVRRGKLARSVDVGAWEFVHDPTPRHIFAFATSSAQIAWIETETTKLTALSGTLYVAPWPSPEAALQIREVGVVENLDYLDKIAVSGRYFVHASARGPKLYRTGDGASWVVPAPAPLRHTSRSEVWLDETHLTYSAHHPDREDDYVLVRCELAKVPFQ